MNQQVKSRIRSLYKLKWYSPSQRPRGLCTQADPSALHVQGPVIPDYSHITRSINQSHLTRHCFSFPFQSSITWLHLPGQRSRRGGRRKCVTEQPLGSSGVDVQLQSHDGKATQLQEKQSKCFSKNLIICVANAKYVRTRNNFELQTQKSARQLLRASAKSITLQAFAEMQARFRKTVGVLRTKQSRITLEVKA